MSIDVRDFGHCAFDGDPEDEKIVALFSDEARARRYCEHHGLVYGIAYFNMNMQCDVVGEEP